MPLLVWYKEADSAALADNATLWLSRAWVFKNCYWKHRFPEREIHLYFYSILGWCHTITSKFLSLFFSLSAHFRPLFSVASSDSSQHSCTKQPNLTSSLETRDKTVHRTGQLAHCSREPWLVRSNCRTPRALAAIGMLHERSLTNKKHFFFPLHLLDIPCSLFRVL